MAPINDLTFEQLGSHLPPNSIIILPAQPAQPFVPGRAAIPEQPAVAGRAYVAATSTTPEQPAIEAKPFVPAVPAVPEQPATLAVPPRVVIDVSKLTADVVNDLADAGVIKSLFLLLDAGFDAQNVVNQTQPVGERLSAFTAPTNGPVANGFVATNRGMTVRAELASATRIVGATV